MNVFLIFLFIIVSYFLLVFVGLRLVAPYMGFKQYTPPTNLPEEIKKAITDLEEKSIDQKSYLQAAYDLIMQKNFSQWKHTRFRAATKLHRLFVKDLLEIWHSNGFIYCTGINFVLYTMLANSKFFKAADVKVRHNFVNMVLHQYLQVKVGENWVDVDPAGTGIRGKPLGSHLSFFG